MVLEKDLESLLDAILRVLILEIIYENKHFHSVVLLVNYFK